MGVRIRPFRTEDLAVVTPFTPNDDDIPAVFEDRHHAYVAEVEESGEILGWILLAGVGRKLFMLCHASTPEGKRRQTPNLLVWHAVKMWAGGPYRYLDIGASYRATLQNYFMGFRQRSYPMIMRPPDGLDIRVTRTPFTSDIYATGPGNPDEGRKWFEEMVGLGPKTFFPNGFFALRAVLKECAEGRNVLVVSSFGTIPERITRAADGVCTLTTEVAGDIAATLLLHEFGIPVNAERVRTLPPNVPIIEDCSEGWGSEGTGAIGSIRLYDFSALFPIRFGAFATGIEIPFERMWHAHGCHDLQKEEKVLGYLAAHLRPLHEIRTERQRVWERYATNLVSVSDSAIPVSEGVMPYAYAASVGDDKEAHRIVEWLERFQIEAGAWPGRAAVLLPCHQAVSDRHADYVAGAFLAMFRERCGLPGR